MIAPVKIFPVRPREKKITPERRVPSGPKEAFVPKNDKSPEPNYELMLGEEA